jgi:hypothetical protein
MMCFNQSCDSLGKDVDNGSIEGLMDCLEKFQGQSVTVDQDGSISLNRWWNIFQVWIEYDQLIFSSEDEEYYIFVSIDDILTWKPDDLLGIDIILNNSMVLSIYKN